MLNFIFLITLVINISMRLIQIVETAIFLVCQNYHLKEDDIRDDNGGISSSLAVTELSVFL
jgi:hypothetical protein